MSLADELKNKIRSVRFCEEHTKLATQLALMDLAEFVDTNEDAILSALRSRDAVLEDAIDPIVDTVAMARTGCLLELRKNLRKKFGLPPAPSAKDSV